MADFKKKFNDATFHYKETIESLGSEALKAQSNAERSLNLILMLTTTNKILVSLYTCDYLIKEDVQYRRICEQVIVFNIATLYKTADKDTKTKIRVFEK